jgi:Glycosyltransferase family 9 (heptosyltransferase)
MSWGDELMAAGEARRIHQVNGGKVRIVARAGGATTLSSTLWDNIDYIAKPGETAAASVVDSPFNRPYRAAFEPYGSRWREYSPFPAQIRLTRSERQFASVFGTGFVLIEPHVKALRDGADNKQWGWERYVALVSSLPEVRWIQVGRPELPSLPGIVRVPTESFRKACAVLAHAAAYVGPEGGLHHASAALGVPAIVIFGGYISPKVTGYLFHTNLFSGAGLGCGRREKCCCDCMARILPSEVARALNAILQRRDRKAESFG